MFKIKEQNNLILSQISDSSLVREIQLRSVKECRDEVTELYRRYSEDVYRMSRSLHEHTEEGIKKSEDLFQSSWQIALERIQRYDISSKGTFGSWVKGIADNLFLEDYRLKSKHETSLSELTYLTPSFDQAENLDDRDQEIPSVLEGGFIKKETLLNTLNILTATEREILLGWFRTYDKNDPGNEIHAKNLALLCEKFSVQKDTIRKIKQRAIDKIQRALKL